MSPIVRCGPVPERVLPAANESAVVANLAVQVDAVEVVGSRIRHHDTGATAPSRTSSTTDARFVVKIGGGGNDDAGEVLGEQSCTGRHVSERADRVEIMPDIDDPGVTHEPRTEREHPRCSSPSSRMPS